MVNDLSMCGVNLTDYDLNSLLTVKQLNSIIEGWTKTHRYSIEKWILTKASDGLVGYLGDHLKLTIVVDVEGKIEDIRLFVKCLPNKNQPKVEFLKNNLFYKREHFVVNELLKNAGGCAGPNQWRPQVYICNEEIVVMQDLTVSGYTIRDKTLYYDLDHCLLTVEALAKYHAASVNYETTKIKIFGNQYRISDKFSNILVELNFTDNAWLRAGAKTTVNFLGSLSKKYNYNTADHKTIEAKMLEMYRIACDSIQFYDDTINVVIHKDLWSNNVMFRYVSGKPVSAVILDFQCVRYAPPAFDISSFLYMNTTRTFRKVFESQILRHYYDSFIRELTMQSVSRLKGYSFEKFLEMFEKSRMFGLLVPVLIFPYVCMDPISAKKYFDDPVTYDRYNNEDRTEPVVGHARQDANYRDKILEVSEEFVENFVL